MKEKIYLIYFIKCVIKYNIFVDLSGNRLEFNMEDVPVPSENTFDVTLPATHSVNIHFLIL